ncbi:hypothetical protein DMC14_001825 [Metamycoplasma phocicerebrale]|uniref:Soluble ligand binding domain-containing protein n=1 Tax=Metamycoplasma phocicerebrale TaxID=142649 RepID=A0A3T0TTU0_9BACT|nr:hypothetical protein [Metamycoplasma phocicerebrale]AZZ65521.1 hypothetical protein DMC14_001825 [Metamycoplasma phocicerebrale]
MKIKFNKKKVFLGLGLFLFSSIIIIGGIIVKTQIYNKIKSNKTLNTKNEYITISIGGAVKYPGDYCLKVGSTFNDIFRESILLSGAYLNNIDKNLQLENNQKIFIPFNSNKKLTISDIRNADILINIGIKPNIANKIFNYISKNNILNWEEVLKIPGVGEKTYLLLVEKIAI